MKKQLIIVALIFVANVAAAQTPAFKVERAGQGQPILFLPGFTCPGAVWNETINNLNGKYEVHKISYAGFNGNAPIRMPWYETIKSELITYMKEHKMNNTTIVGHSMGGMMAVDLAAAAPDYVSKIVVVDGLPCLRELWMPGVKAEQIRYESPYNQQMLAQTPEQVKDNAKMMSAGMTTNTSKIDIITQWTMEADRETFVYGYTDLLKLDLRDVLPQVKAKVLIIGASFPDANVVKTNFDKQYANLVSKSIVIADNSRHFVMFDRPEWFYNQVNTFLAGK
jgi:pimeloyl-ACP methyl ester carboxylesterase